MPQQTMAHLLSAAVLLLAVPEVIVQANGERAQAQRSPMLNGGEEPVHQRSVPEPLHQRSHHHARHHASRDEGPVHRRSVLELLHQGNHHHAHHQASHEHESWRRIAFAMTPDEIEQVKKKEAEIAAQGHRLRERKAAFYELLNECPQGDVACERQVLADQVRSERRLAHAKRLAGHTNAGEPQVQDAMGRSMPLLFGGRQAAVTRSGAGSARPSLAALLQQDSRPLCCAAGADPQLILTAVAHRVICGGNAAMRW
eukprot:CAMPEP_0171206388 /NCGR_PEP_ID=MMETSP0790-20130122/27038_1 /TAXON_ID=2925 /ORGANISM="Alexandrium catenella, Strain OF101" /LENGTH=255 /DNA_ID=CAMNT_0011671933 /DNA_START=32 /DNA_END=797 /DNA_ORIENTATION=+